MAGNASIHHRPAAALGIMAMVLLVLAAAPLRAGQPDPEVVELVVQTSAELGIQRREIDDDEVLKRCLYPLVNEGARVLEEGIALRPCDIDIVYINGYGFPEVTGGPMFWADKQGLDRILADIRRFQEEYGDFWKPAPLLERLSRQGHGLEILASDHHPSLWNKKVVDRQWIFFSRGESARAAEELRILRGVIEEFRRRAAQLA